jgi:hypothetical protein
LFWWKIKDKVDAMCKIVCTRRVCEVLSDLSVLTVCFSRLRRLFLIESKSLFLSESKSQLALGYGINLF